MGILTKHTIKTLNKRIHSKYQIDRYHCHISFQTLRVEQLYIRKVGVVSVPDRFFNYFMTLFK